MGNLEPAFHIVSSRYQTHSKMSLTVRKDYQRMGGVIEQLLVLSHFILSTMPPPSYQINYPTLIWFQFGCYGTALYLIFYILLLFGLVDIIIRFDSCLALLHTADSMPSHHFILLTLKPYHYSAKLYSYSAIFLYVLSFTPYLLVSDSSDSRIISHWRISGLYLIGW